MATQSAFPGLCTILSNLSPLYLVYGRQRFYGRTGVPLIHKPLSSARILCLRDHHSREFGHGVDSDQHSKPEGNNQPAPLPPKPVVPPWLSWVFWSILYIVPLFSMKEGKPPRLIEKVEEAVEVLEEAVQAVEDVAEAVNDVADVIEKVSSDLADDLPEDSMLKRAAEGVEKAADVVGDAAEDTVDLINKVQSLEEELESKVDNLLYRRLGEMLHSLKNNESKKKSSGRTEGKGGGPATAN